MNSTLKQPLSEVHLKAMAEAMTAGMISMNDMRQAMEQLVDVVRNSDKMKRPPPKLI